MQKAGVADSKVLSDERRRRVVGSLGHLALFAVHHAVPPELTFAPGIRPAWAQAIVGCVRGVVELLHAGPWKGSIQVIVDGEVDVNVAAALAQYGTVSFRVGADKHVPAVSAASIVAKTVRNDLMMELHKQFPKYGWARNAGYGTPEHLQAIERHGVCEQHRQIKRLKKYARR